MTWAWGWVLDVHKRKISYCVKDGGGKVYAEGSISATRFDLDRWMKTLPQPWSAAMEATMFTGWIYDYLKPHAAALKVAHPLMLRFAGALERRRRASTKVLISPGPRIRSGLSGLVE